MPPTAAKKPPPQAVPEPAPDPIQATAIVVIHPGSQNLYLGRASDTYPQIVPHCIAWRHREEGVQEHFEDKWLTRVECQHSDVKILQKSGVKIAEEAIKYRPTSMGEYRTHTSTKQIFQLNSDVSIEKSDVPSGLQWTNTEQNPEYLVGEDALYVQSDDCYNLHWPIRRGHLNLHDGPHGSLSAIMQDIETIWSHGIEKVLEIPVKDLMFYRAVLLIPDIFNKQHIRELFQLILDRLGFAAAFIVQESVCATFGSGVSSACVVDIGDQKTSVCCVEDGLSQQNTRLCMEYGGSDISRTFHWLLMKSGLPYKECNPSVGMDALFLQELKELYCHLDQDVQGLTEQHIQIKTPGRNISKCTVQMGDERLISAMGLFYPDMFGLKGEKLCRVYKKERGDPSDPFDEDYLQQTQSRQEQAARQNAAKKKETGGPNQSMMDMTGDDTQMSLTQMEDEDANDQNDSMATEGATSTKGNKKAEEEDVVDMSQGLMGVDQAILKSIDKCDSDEMKKRMYSCMIVVGGGMMFEGAQSWLQYMVWTQMPGHFRLQLETMDVITRPKEMDPRFTCWKGGAVLCILDTSQELWIRQREFKKLGVKILRERAPFPW